MQNELSFMQVHVGEAPEKTAQVLLIKGAFAFICSMKNLVCLVGPTASGKTSTAIWIARKLEAEIISADSRQIYAEMNIGTAKPSPSELSAVPHHFIGHVSIQDYYSAGRYVEEVNSFLDSYFRRASDIVICGGTGLYFNALFHGIDREAVSGHIRDSVNSLIENEGLEALVEALRKTDPTLASQVELTNPRRVMRALEWVLAGKPEKPKRNLPPDWKITKIGLEVPRDILYQRINERVDQMLGAGLWKEAEDLFPQRHLYSLQTVGYQEIFKSIQGIISEKRAVELIKQHTRNYAKRQITWFKRDPEIQWFAPEDQAGIAAALGLSHGI